MRAEFIDWDKIRYLILDVDGTMTDGGVYLDSQGNETKKFSIKDGAGILLARQGGIQPVILTGRESLCVTQRARELQIPYVFQNVKKKKEFLREFFRERQVSREEAAEIIEFRYPEGYFMVKEDGKFVGIDNSDGDAFTEEFKSKERCIRWLAGEEFYDDEDEVDNAGSDGLAG